MIAPHIGREMTIGWKKTGLERNIGERRKIYNGAKYKGQEERNHFGRLCSSIHVTDELTFHEYRIHNSHETG
jgi:hypothetical protein